MSNSLSNMLNAILLANGWSEQKAAVALGVSQPTVNRIRRSDDSSVRYDVGVRIQQLYIQSQKSGEAA